MMAILCVMARETWNVSNVIDKLIFFSFYFILISLNVNLNSCMWLVVTSFWGERREQYNFRIYAQK